MTSPMAFAISTPSSSASSFLHSTSASTPSTGVRTPPRCYFPNPRNTTSQRIKCTPHLGFTQFSQWNGLKLAGISISQHSLKIERKVKKGKGVHASLFGVGAPEVLVIGVVALLVFGPKGLAEVARNLGKTLRAFQPTIRELQEVSREFKSSLEREIGLDDIDNPVPNRSSPNTTIKPETTNLEPNASSTENGEVTPDASIQLKADLFRETLAQLQKEQQEEKEREEANGLSEAESPTPSPDTPQALDTPQEDSGFSGTSPSQNPDGSALQETTSAVVPKDSSPKTETQT